MIDGGRIFAVDVAKVIVVKNNQYTTRHITKSAGCLQNDTQLKRNDILKKSK